MNVGPSTGPSPGVPETAPGRGTELARKVAVNTSLFVAARGIVMATGIVATGIATRYLGADGFGELALAIAFTAMAVTAADFGLYTAAVRHLAREPEQERQLLVSLLSVGTVIAFVMTLVALGLMALLYPGGENEQVREAILVLLVPLLLAAPMGSANAYMVLKQRAVPALLAALFSSVALLAGLIVTVTLDLGFLGAALSYAAQGLVNSAAMVLAGRRVVPRRLERPNPVWRKLFVSALPQAGLLLLGVVYFRLDTVLLSLFDSDRQVALYGLAYRVIEGLGVLPFLFMTTLFPEVARREPGDPRLAELVNNAFSTMVAAVPGVCVVFVVFNVEVARVIGGAEFADAGVVIALLMVALGLLAPSVVLYQSLLALGRQRRLLTLLGIVLVVNVAANLALIPPLGAAGAALGLVLSEAVGLAIVLDAFRRLDQLPSVYRPLRLLAVTAIAASAGIGLHRLGAELGASDVVDVGLGGGLTFVIYGIALIVLRAAPPALEMVTRPIEERLGRRRGSSRG